MHLYLVYIQLQEYQYLLFDHYFYKKVVLIQIRHDNKRFHRHHYSILVHPADNKMKQMVKRKVKLEQSPSKSRANFMFKFLRVVYAQALKVLAAMGLMMLQIMRPLKLVFLHFHLQKVEVLYILTARRTI